MTVVLLGLFIFLIGISPDLIGMDRSPVVGFVQVGVWLTGLAALLLGTYLTIRVIRNGRYQTLRADVGVRLMATGYVVASAASLAVFIGIGSHTLPGLVFGHLQVIGLVLGVMVSLVGVVLFWPRAATPSEAGAPVLAAS